MKLKNFLKMLKCRVFICCNSKCSLNDTDGDGQIDTIKIENIKEQKNKYDNDTEYKIPINKRYSI